jgi:hypothetical protein
MNPIDNVLGLYGNALLHYGIKGMRWGVRRKNPSSSSSASEDYVRARSAASKPTSSLSNQEMRALIERMELEKRYQSVMTTAPANTRTARAKRFASNLLLDVGSRQVTRISRTAADIYIENLLNGTPSGSTKNFGKQIGSRITPGGSSSSKKKKK